MESRTEKTLRSFDAAGEVRSVTELSKEEINHLPLQRYTGTIRLIRSAGRIPEAVDELGREKLLGFDTETRPAFRKGTHFPPSLIQLASAEAVYLFQIGLTGFTKELRDLLRDPDLIKVGVGLDYDLRELAELNPFQAAGIVDLSLEAQALGMKRVSLRTLAATFLGFRISKGAKCSNWAARNLKPNQVVYAATDAWVSREIFLKMPASIPPPGVSDAMTRRES